MCKFTSVGVVLRFFSFFKTPKQKLHLGYLIVPALSSYRPVMFCNPARPTFRVESTFGINRQTRLLTGLWKYPRLAIRLHKKSECGFFAFWVMMCVCSMCSDGAWTSAGWMAVLGPRIAGSCGDRLWPTAVAGGLSAAHEPFGGCFDSKESCSVSGWQTVHLLNLAAVFLVFVFLNKVLLEHNAAHFFTCCLWLLSCYKGRIE